MTTPNAPMPSPPRTHACPGGCEVQVSYRRYACRACWYRLPFDLRTTITAIYQAGRRAEHRAAMQAAHEWFKAHRPGVPDGKP